MKNDKALTPGCRIDVNIDDTGYRRYTVTRVGPVWVTLLTTYDLAKTVLKRSDLERNPTLRVVDYSPRVVKRLIKRALSERRALGLRHAGAEAKLALELIGA